MDPRTSSPMPHRTGGWPEWLSLMGYAGAVAIAVSGALVVAVILLTSI